MAQYFLLLGLIRIVLLSNVARAEISRYIIGGYYVGNSEFPHQVSIQVQTTSRLLHHCGGSIIAPSWILTAAHCVEYPVGSYQIVAGITQLSDTNPERQDRKIENVFVHPKYNGTSHIVLSDIALVKLDKPLEFNGRIQAIQLPKSGVKYSGKAKAIGWGTTDAKVVRYSNKLKSIAVEILPSAVCGKLVASPFLSEMHICTSSQVNEGACFGDSGGPLMQNNYIIGIASFVTPECGKTVVFTRVSSYIDFIKQHVQI